MSESDKKEQPKKINSFSHGLLHDVSEGTLVDSCTRRRLLLIDVNGWQAADRELANALGFAAKIVMYRRGLGHGKAAAIDMKNKGDGSMESLVKLAKAWGWGKVSYLQDGKSILPSKVTYSNCPLCQGIRSDEPLCNFIAGTIAGFLTEMMQVEVKVKETECRACGGDKCEFLVEITSLYVP